MFSHLFPSRDQHAPVRLYNLDSIIVPSIVTGSDHYTACAHLFSADGHDETYAEKNTLKQVSFVAKTSRPVAEMLLGIGVATVEVLDLF